jgi:hypothetical protein
MEVLLPPLLPVISVLLVTVVQRRYGPRLGGRLAGFPTTTFPFLLVLLARAGAGAVADAARGMIAGQLVVAAFCLGYGRVARRARRPAVAATVALAVAAAALSLVAEVRSPWLAAAVTGAVVLAGLVTWPPVPRIDTTTLPPRWEVPVRVGAAAAVVTALAVLSSLLGPHLAGVLACTPVVLAILTPTTHRGSGFAAAETLVRSALRSLPGTCVFAVVTAWCVVPLGPVAAFGLAGAGLFAADQLVGRMPAARRPVGAGQAR